MADAKSGTQDAKHNTLLTQPVTRREAMRTIGLLIGVPFACGILSTACSSDLTGPAAEGYRKKVEQKIVQKDEITSLGPFRVRLVEVVVENEAKKIKKATLEFLNDKQEPYLIWPEFNLKDMKTGIRQPGGEGDYAIVCVRMPEFASTDQWVELQLWKKAAY